MDQKKIIIGKNQLPIMIIKEDQIINLKEEGIKIFVQVRYLKQTKQLLCFSLKEQAHLNHLYLKLLYLLTKVLNNILVNKKYMMWPSQWCPQNKVMTRHSLF